MHPTIQVCLETSPGTARWCFFCLKKMDEAFEKVGLGYVGDEILEISIGMFQ